MTIIRVGLDTSKHVFQIHGVDENEQPVLAAAAAARRGRESLRQAGGDANRARGVRRLASLGAAAARFGASGDAAAAAIHQALRQARQERHDRRRSDLRGDEPAGHAICAGQEQQAALVLGLDPRMLGARDLLVKQRTMLINAIRGHAAEFRRYRGQGTPAGKRASGAPGKRRGRAGAGARDDRGAGQPAQRARHQAEGDRGAADGLAPAGSDEPMPGDDPRDRADRRGQLCPQEPALAKAGVADAKAFRSGRHFAAGIGITPREDSTAGRQKLGRISRAGDEDLPRLLVIGATAVIRAAKPGRAAPWLRALLARKSKKVAALALANKMARIVWAMMVSGETYRRPAQA
jgi:transposase